MIIIKLMKVYDKIIGSAIDILITDISTGIAKNHFNGFILCAWGCVCFSLHWYENGCSDKIRSYGMCQITLSLASRFVSCTHLSIYG